jgi:pimeloyl-ACP methyl ester carboxylesterase
MSRRWKIAIGVAIGAFALLGLNAIVLSNQTKDAHTTVEGGQIVDAFGGQMQVTDTGRRDGSPIVLIHCYTCDLRWWDGMLGDLEQQHRVIRIDLLGHGGSEKPAEGYSMENQAGTVASVLSSIGVDHATVVGHSLGFTVATALAERSPALVSRLVDIDQAPDNSYGSAPFLARLGYWPLIGPATYRVTPDFAIRDTIKVAFAPGYNMAQGFENPDQPVVDFHAMTYNSFKKSSQDETDFTDEKPLDQRLAELKTPIPLLVIFGADDQVYDAQKALDAYSKVPGASVSKVEGAGHSPNVEKPKQTAALVLEFAANPGDEVAPSKPEFTPPNKHRARNKKKSGSKSKSAAGK